MDALVAILSQLPWVNIIGELSGAISPSASSAPALLYDVMQVMTGLHILGKGARYVADRTPWKWDDHAALWLVRATAEAIDWLSRFVTANDVKVKR